MLLPVDLRDWVPEDDLVSFVFRRGQDIRARLQRINERGTAMPST